MQTFGPVTKEKAMQEEVLSNKEVEDGGGNGEGGGGGGLMNFPHFPDRKKQKQESSSAER